MEKFYSGAVPINCTSRLIPQQMLMKSIPMEANSVTESIGEEYRDWVYKTPILIDSPTGTGKTSFIYNKVIPFSISNGNHLLMVSNRIALSLQQKKAIISIVKNYAPELLPHSLENIAVKDMKDVFYIGPVCVCTYQGLHNLLNNPNEQTETNFEWFRQLTYTVFDEIHYLYADALFNSMCGYLLRKLPAVFNNCVRIYMTATSWEIVDPLIDAEQNHYEVKTMIPPGTFEYYLATRYHTRSNNGPIFNTFCHYYKDADYSHYRLHFFEDSQYVPSIGKKAKAELTMRKPYLLTLLSLIENSHPNKDNKWVIFVDKISSGKALLEVITDNGISAAYFDAETKKPLKAWKKVLTDETFDESVLIATPVIDCGVNLKDPAIKNIAILCTERTTFMQLIGRKRLAPDEIIHLWVWAPPSTYFKNMSKRIVSHLELAEDLNDARKHWPSHSYKYADDVRRLWEWNSTHKIRYPSLFYVDNSGFFQVSVYVFNILIKRLEFLRQFTNDVNPIDFRTVVKQWLGLPEAQESPETNQIAANITASVSRLKLSAMLEASTACSLSEEDFMPIRKAIITEALTHRIEKIRSDRMDKLSAKPLNRFLSALMLPYTIKKKANMWAIENKPQ